MSADPAKPSTTTDAPVQVFIMMGQSNMLGFGAVKPVDKPGTLQHLVEKQSKYRHLVDQRGKWVEMKDTCRYVQVMHQNGKMHVHRNEWLTLRTHFGPELGFGHVMGPYLAARDKRVLLLKACIGNRSLGWDLLPPGSPSFEYDDKIYAGYKQSPNFWTKGSTPEPVNWYAGKQYDDDVQCCKDVLEQLDTYYPGAKSYEIAGFVWWQGHKDQNDALASKYEENLVRLIQSLRQDFQAPQAKFVLATIAFDGFNLKGPGLIIANAQLAVSGEKGKYPEFRDNVKTIEARPFWRDEQQSPVRQGHHYNQNAETFYEVGHALGQAMVDLIEGRIGPSSSTSCDESK